MLFATTKQLLQWFECFRDLEEVFMPAGVVVGALVKPDGGALTAARTPDLVRHLEGIAQIIARKMDMERKYISRLEGGVSLSTVLHKSSFVLFDTIRMSND